jgi:hypothetical protein
MVFVQAQIGDQLLQLPILFAELSEFTNLGRPHTTKLLLPSVERLLGNLEPFVWALALPVLGVFLVADLVWGSLLLRGGRSRRRLWWLVTVAVWLLAIAVDFSRH